MISISLAPSRLHLSLTILSLLSLSQPTWSASQPPTPVADSAHAGVKDSAAADSASKAALAAITSEPLLPEILSPGERIMWGEHGLMRWTGLFPLTEESREKELGLRRTMLTVHEIGGFITLGAMLTTVVYGQLTMNGYKSLGDTHVTLATATIASYFTTAALSLLSPPPMIRRKEWNTISIHKGLAIVHFTGMILTPLLADGVAMRERGTGRTGLQIDHDKARIHQVSGYITTVAFASAMAVVTF